MTDGINDQARADEEIAILAGEILAIAVQLGIIEEGFAVTGPQVLLLAADIKQFIADAHPTPAASPAGQQEADVVLGATYADERGEYPHLLWCNGNRRIPAGIPGHSCCYLNHHAHPTPAPPIERTGPPVADEPARTLPRLVACAAIIRDGSVLLERRAPSGVAGLDGMWDLPGGKLECGESVIECLVREIAEELSVGIRPGRMLPYLPTSDWVYADGQRRHWVLAAFECSLISGEPVCNERLRWFKLTDLPTEMLEADRRLLSLVERTGAAMVPESKRALWFNEWRPIINAIGEISVQEAMDAIERDL